jgi:type VI secretion system protein ImpA
MTPTIPIEKLLQPVTGDKPGGEDGWVEELQRQWEAATDKAAKAQLKAEINRRTLLHDDLRRQVQNLEYMIQPKPPVEIRTAKGEQREVAPAAECDWAAVKEEAVAMLGRIKDLRVSLILCLAAFKEDGLDGLRDGLELVSELLSRYWEPLFPRLDPEDKDPTSRLSVLQSLSLPLATESPYRFIALLREAPLCQSPKHGGIGLRHILAAQHAAAEGGAAGQPGISLKQIKEAFQAADPAQLQNTAQQLRDIRARLDAIRSLFIQKAGEANTPAWELLETTLQEMQACLAANSAPAGAGADAGAEAAVPGPGSAPGNSHTLAGSTPGPALTAGPLRITSRPEVEAALEAICAYYHRNEPSSPVPLLLERARRLCRLGFLQIMEDLHPEALKELQNITGAKPENKS